MKYKIIVLFTLILSLFSSSIASANLSKDWNSLKHTSVALVELYYWEKSDQGIYTMNYMNSTGFFIDKNTVVTAAHFVLFAPETRDGNEDHQVKSQFSVSLKSKKNNNIRAEVKSYEYSKEDDIAILHIGNGTLSEMVKPLILETSSIREGSTYVAGYPVFSDGQQSFTSSSGSVIRTEVKNETPMIRTTNYTDGGNSGSPLINEQGNVIGVVIIKTTYYSDSSKKKETEYKREALSTDVSQVYKLLNHTK